MKPVRSDEYDTKYKNKKYEYDPTLELTECGNQLLCRNGLSWNLEIA